LLKNQTVGKKKSQGSTNKREITLGTATTLTARTSKLVLTASRLAIYEQDLALRREVLCWCRDRVHVPVHQVAHRTVNQYDKVQAKRAAAYQKELCRGKMELERCHQEFLSQQKKEMPLFRCRKCGIVENTALTLCSWMQPENPLCSYCCPKQKKWHGRFSRTQEMPEGERDHFANHAKSKNHSC